MRRRRPSAAAAGGADGAAPPAKRQRVVDGVAEGDALQRRLEDITRPGLDLLIVGYNPGVASAARGHHFAGDGNHMWPCLRWYASSGWAYGSASPPTSGPGDRKHRSAPWGCSERSCPAVGAARCS
eukprot:TRINITY_DN12465_c0_g1_i1.p4 TRINITY_DN12465_c0_g1~~TRINITY_DN12465_c0_g1_i1.p4  ORF type:complete len:126 (+),score=11.48 TRINITY_DN12465_c0_g1_i1:77-454(+)